MANTIGLNSVLFGAGQSRKGPSNIEREYEGYGVDERAANAEPMQIADGFKWHWTLTWDKVDPTTRAAVATIAQIYGTFPFVDQDGTTYTVQCPLSGRYRDGIAINGANNTVLYYGVTLVFEQV